MADQDLTQLTETTSVADDALVYIVTDPTGVPVDRKITGANLKTALGVGGGGRKEGNRPVRTSGVFWHPPANASTVSTGAPNFINYIYATPFYAPIPMRLLAVGFFVNTAGDATNEFRLGVWPDVDGEPGEILDQTTIATDSTGLKTWTLDAPLDVEGWLYVGAGSQGTGAMPAVRKHGESWWLAAATAESYSERISQAMWRMGPVSGVITTQSFAPVGNTTIWLEARMEPAT